MKISLLLVGDKKGRASTVAAEAALIAFPEAARVSLGFYSDALAREPASGPEILVLTNSNEAEILQATLVLDGGRLPRWAVVAAGDTALSPLADVVPAADWNPSVLSRAFRSGVALNQLRRENARFRGDLLSVGVRIAHDLRSPLGGILAATEALNEFLEKNAAEGKALSRPIVESTDDLVRIIGQLTLWAKASALEEAPQVFNMATAAERALTRTELRASRTGAVVKSPASWPEVQASPAKTEAVWLALIENALGHSGDSPKIELGWVREASMYRFWVQDAGVGVASEKRKTLFQQFHLLHTPNSVRGLGLPIVERLVGLQGGTCGYSPTEGGGSCFFFTLPAAG
jgi:K+-sensing histidine kinase KdpD